MTTTSLPARRLSRRAKIALAVGAGVLKLAVDNAGNVYVADSIQDRVLKLEAH